MNFISAVFSLFLSVYFNVQISEQFKSDRITKILCTNGLIMEINEQVSTYAKILFRCRFNEDIIIIIIIIIVQVKR